MKKIVFLFLLSIASYSQCVKCNSFDEAAKNPTIVKSIIINSYVHGIELNEIPKSIEQFVNLEILFLSDQQFTSVPAEIGKLTHLKSISFGGCMLQSIPDELFQLKELEEVILANNEFTDEYKAALEKRFKAELPKVKVML